MNIFIIPSLSLLLLLRFIQVSKVTGRTSFYLHWWSSVTCLLLRSCLQCVFHFLYSTHVPKVSCQVRTLYTQIKLICHQSTGMTSVLRTVKKSQSVKILVISLLKEKKNMFLDQ